MDAQTIDLLRDSLPLLGVALGALMAGALAGRSDAQRWRRDFILGLHHDTRDYFGEAVTALDRQWVLIGQQAEYLAGKRSPVSEQQIAEVDAAWRRVLSLRGVRTGPDVQAALAAFDTSREACVLALNAHDSPGYAKAGADLAAKREACLDAMREYQEALGAHLAKQVLPFTVRAWRRLRRQGVNYL